MAPLRTLLILTSSSLLLLLACICLHISTTSSAQIHTWPTTTTSTAASMSIYPGGDFQDLADLTLEDEIIDDHDAAGMSSSIITTTDGRRSLYWHRAYYISYGALSANRVPCPPRSGRSYYTHNCYRARGPVHPYTRGCSCIARCRR